MMHDRWAMVSRWTIEMEHFTSEMEHYTLLSDMMHEMDDNEMGYHATWCKYAVSCQIRWVIHATWCKNKMRDGASHATWCKNKD
jgi:hypothetical protein